MSGDPSSPALPSPGARTRGPRSSRGEGGGGPREGPCLAPFLDFACFSPYVLTANLVSEPILSRRPAREAGGQRPTARCAPGRAFALGSPCSGPRPAGQPGGLEVTVRQRDAPSGALSVWVLCVQAPRRQARRLLGCDDKDEVE